MEKLPRNVRILGWCSFLNDVASEMIYPLLPQFLITVLGGNKFYLGIIEGTAESIASFNKLWAGAWSDRAGNRKPFILFGYSVAAIARPIIGLVTSPWQVFAVRICDRIGKGIRTSPRDAMIADSAPSKLHGRAFGFHRSMDHLGAAIGPLLAAAFLWLYPGELRSLFLVAGIPGIIVLLLLVFGLREKEAMHKTKAAPTATRESLVPLSQFDGRFRWYLLSLLFFTLGNSSDAFLLVRAGELGVPLYLLPVLWFAFHIVKSGANIYAGRLTDRIGAKRPILIGWLAYAVVYLGFGFATDAWQVWALFLVYGFFFALTEPAEKKFVVQLVGEQRRGLGFGWYHFTLGIAALPSSLIFGWLYQTFGSHAAFGTGAMLAVVSAVLLALIRPHQPMAEVG
ncbi:MAG: MFS transporter [Planctomycetes bacterium]|nr:MFS transporter [Planctomycetota bacterium]